MNVRKRVAIVGLGNPIAGDDSVGIRVLKRISSIKLPECVDVFELQSPALDLAPILKDYEKVIIIDAVKLGRRPGTIIKLKVEDLITMFSHNVPRGRIFSLHDMNAAEALLMLMELLPELRKKDLVLIGIEIEEIRKFEEVLSNEVENAIDKVVDIVLKELER